MIKMIATRAVISKGYDGAPALRFSEGTDNPSVRFKIGVAVYDKRAENKVDVLEVNNLLKIYFKGKEIAVHTLETRKKGEHITDKNHYPSSKNISQAEILSNIRPKVYEIGSGAIEFYERHRKANALNHLNSTRILYGLLSLKKKYPDEVINRACLRACHYGNISYQTVKSICEKGVDMLPIGDVEHDFCVEGIPTSKVRDLSEYSMIAALGVISHE